MDQAELGFYSVFHFFFIWMHLGQVGSMEDTEGMEDAAENKNCKLVLGAFFCCFLYPVPTVRADCPAGTARNEKFS